MSDSQLGYASLTICSKKTRARSQMVISLDPVHTAPEEFENGVFTLKTHQMSVHTTPEEFEKATIVAHFGFVFEETLDREIINHMIIGLNVTSSFSKSSSFLLKNVFPTKTKYRRFQIPPV